MKEPSEFEKHTTTTMHKNGRCTIACKKGLWSVDAPSKNEATIEAVGYFLQYWEDGEYSDGSPEDLLARRYAVARRNEVTTGLLRLANALLRRSA